jgi:hypothetical protein
MPSFAEKLATLRQEAPERYSSFTLSLAAARANVEFPIAGSYFYIHDGTDSAATITVRFNELRNNPLPVVRGEGYKLPFYRMFITNTAQAGKSVTVVIGVEEPGEFEILQNRFSVDIAGVVPVSFPVVPTFQEYFNAVGDNGSIVNNAATNTILATTGPLAAGVYRVHYTAGAGETGAAAPQHISLEHRNAANDANISATLLLCVGNLTANIAGTLPAIQLALNERIQIKVLLGGATWTCGGMLQWKRIY